MSAFLVRRLINYLILTFIAASLAYLLASAAFHPRDRYLQKNPPVAESIIQNELNARNSNPDTPILVRYERWVSGLAHGDFGRTYDGGSVNHEFGIRAWVTVRLVTIGSLVAAVAGIAVGAFAAVRQYRPVDHVVTFASYVIFATPVFVLAPVLKLIAVNVNKAAGSTVLQYVGEYDVGKVHGFWPVLLSRADHLILPTVSLVLFNAAFYSRFQRSTMLDVLGSDFLRTARAKGLTKGQAIRRHGVRTAVIPVMTLIVFGTLAIFAGAIITESVFDWHGLGQWFVVSADNADVNSVAAISIFSAVLVLIAGMLADIVTAALDPRVRL